MAELQEILEVNDFSHMFQSVNNLPNAPSRAQIEDVLTDNNVALPLQNNVKFFLRASGGKVVEVFYSKALDTYYTKKLDTAS